MEEAQRFCWSKWYRLRLWKQLGETARGRLEWSLKLRALLGAC